jgi:hypothetical protein
MHFEVEKIIELITNNPMTADDGRLANTLLEQFQKGASLNPLRSLMLSPDSDLAGLGAWIASELGENGMSLRDLVGHLLQHPSPKVRFWMIDCVLLWMDSSNGKELSQTVRLIDDPEKSVRWKTMVFLSRATRRQLNAALAWLDKTDSQSPVASELRWLLDNGERDDAAVEAMLHDSHPRMRKFAAVAATRMAAQNQHPLLIAASSSDSEIAEFTGDSLNQSSM